MSDSVSQPVPRRCSTPDSGRPISSCPIAPDHRVGTTQFRGRPVVLAFYPADWSPVCGDQMALYQAVLPEFAQVRRGVLGISVDSVWWHRAFAEARGLQFPLLADFEPKGEVARRYGVVPTSDGVASGRCSCIDGEGVVALELLSPAGSTRAPTASSTPSTALAADGRPCYDHTPSGDRPAGVPVDDRRPHPRPGGRAGHAGRVRRLPVPVLRHGVPDRARSCCGSGGDRCGSCTGTSRSPTSHPYAELAAEVAEAAGGPGAVLGDARLALRAPDQLDRRQLSVGVEQLGLPRTRSPRRSAGTSRRPGPAGLRRRGPQRGQRHADVLHQRASATTAATHWRSCSRRWTRPPRLVSDLFAM